MVSSITVNQSQNGSPLSKITESPPSTVVTQDASMTSSAANTTSVGPCEVTCESERGETASNTQDSSSANFSSVAASPKRRKLRDFIEMEKKIEEGYNSDGGIGPFFDCWEDEDEQMLDEDKIPKEMDDEVDATAVTTVAEEGGSDQDVVTAEVVEEEVLKYIHIVSEAVMAFGVKELKKELKKRNLKVGGKKEELRTRLLKALEDKVMVGPSEDSSK